MPPFKIIVVNFLFPSGPTSKHASSFLIPPGPVNSISLLSRLFIAGTLIETSEGLKPIETFVGGELIWSRNDTTLEYGYRPVIATKVTENQPIFEVIVKDKHGRAEKLETTSEHPFWIKDVGWLKASLLDLGMTLLDRNNEELEVVSQHLVPNRLETVYNIEVDDFHTYHVGKLGIWVHNANCCNVSIPQPIWNATFRKDLAQHLTKFDGITSKGEVSGTHNMAVFDSLQKTKGVIIVSKTPTSTPGIYEVIYKVPAYHPQNQTLITHYKQPKTKTVYDPSVFSDSKILEMAQIAANNGYANGVQAFIQSSGKIYQYEEKYNGVTFISYLAKDNNGHIFISN